MDDFDTNAFDTAAFDTAAFNLDESISTSIIDGITVEFDDTIVDGVQCTNVRWLSRIPRRWA